jgi:hypothetical protein
MNLLRPTAETWFDQGRDGQTNSHEDGTEMKRKARALLLMLMTMMTMITNYCASRLNIV